MRCSVSPSVLALAASIAFVPAVHAHEPDARIEEISAALAEEPTPSGSTRARLLAKRAELTLEAGGELADALVDVEAAVLADPGDPALEALRARTYLEAGEPSFAATLLAGLASGGEVDPALWSLYGRAAMEAGEPALAADALVRSIDATPRPAARAYVALSAARAAAGDADGARTALDRGEARLGPVVGLIDAQVELELRRGRPEEALRCFDRHDEAMRRAPGAHARRGQLLHAAGRDADAAEEGRLGLAALDSLPDARRRAPALREADAALRDLRALAPGEGAASPSGAWRVGLPLLVAVVAALARARRR